MRHNGVFNWLSALRKARNLLLAALLSGLLSLVSLAPQLSPANAAPATPPAPVVTVTFPTPPSTQVTFTFEGQPSDTFWCSIDDAPYFECGATYVYNYTDGLNHTIKYYLEQPNKTVSEVGTYELFDQIPPLAPSIVGLDASTDSATIGDALTSNRRPKLNLSGLELEALAGGEWFLGATAIAGCEFLVVAETGSCTPETDLVDGTYVFQASQVDQSNNQSVLVEYSFEVDGTAPVDLELELADESNTGSKTDLTTTENSPKLNLSLLEVGAKYLLTLSSPGHSNKTCEFEATAAEFSCDFKSLAVGTWTASAVGSDAAGNESSPATFTLKIAKVPAVVDPEDPTDPNDSNTNDPTDDPTDEGESEPVVEPTAEPTPEPTDDPNETDSGAAGSGGKGGSGSSTSDQGEPFDPLGSPEAIQDTNEVTTLAMALVAALAAAGSRRGSARKSENKSAMPEQASQADAGIESIEVELRDFEVDHEGVGDALPMFDNKFFTAIDKPSHDTTMAIANYSPVVAKIFNEGAYLRSITGVLSLLAPFIGVVLGVLAIGTPSEYFLPPVLWVFIAISVLGIFDASAGFVASVIYAVGALAAHSQFSALTANDLRLVAGVFIVGFGPALLASAFREFRRPAEAGTHYWWERITDFAVVPLIGYLTVSSMVGALPALAGIKLDVADAATDFGIAIAVALIVRVALEELAARAFPKRLNLLHPSSFPERPLWMQAVSLLIRTAIFVFISASLLGNYWQTWVGCALMTVPTILSWFADKWPNSVWLWRLIPQGIPGMITALLIGIGSSLLVNQSLGVTPEYARMSFVLMQIPMIAFSVLGLFGREGEDGEVRWLQRPQVAWVYRLGGIAMLAWVLLLTGVV